jgi:hypothetical protein
LKLKQSIRVPTNILLEGGRGGVRREEEAEGGENVVM